MTEPTTPLPSGSINAEPPFLPRLGDDSADRQVPVGITGVIEAMLRSPRRIIFQLQQGQARRVTISLVIIGFVCSLTYGVIVGSFSGEAQWWAAPIKISLGMFCSALICLPSLYIFACLGGSQARLSEVLGLLFALVALTTLLLIGFSPVAWIFSQSTQSVAAMGALHLVFWLTAVVFGACFLANAFYQLGCRSVAGIKLWLVIFVLVTLQMTSALRPLLGTSDEFLPKEKKFFLDHWNECLKQKPPTRGAQPW